MFAWKIEKIYYVYGSRSHAHRVLAQRNQDLLVRPYLSELPSTLPFSIDNIFPSLREDGRHLCLDTFLKKDLPVSQVCGGRSHLVVCAPHSFPPYFLGLTSCLHAGTKLRHQLLLKFSTFIWMLGNPSRVLLPFCVLYWPVETQESSLSKQFIPFTRRP